MKIGLCAAGAVALALSPAIRADEVSDLKAEIAAQKAAADAQKARLDALEQKLNAMQQAPAPAAAAATHTTPTPAGTTVDYKYGDGLSVKSTYGQATLYGLIDISYVRANHADPKNHSVFGPRVAWFSGNRWGITGSRPLGTTGLDGIFRLESEFESQTGAMDTPGVLFNRDSWIGVQGESIGKLTFGRQNAVGRDPIASAIYGDPYGPAGPSLEEGGYTNNNNFKQLIFYAGSATGTRIDNGVVWKKGFGPIWVGAQYQFGNIPGDFNNGTTKTVSLAYGGGFWNVAGFATDAKVADRTDRAYSAGGNVTFGPARVNAGWFHYTGEQGALGGRRDNAYTLSTKLAFGGPLDYELGVQRMKANNAAVNSAGNVLNAFANSTAATATATGSRSTVYGSAFYHFDKVTEAYLAADYLKLKDGYKVGVTNGAKSQTEVGIGVRTRF